MTTPGEILPDGPDTDLPNTPIPSVDEPEEGEKTDEEQARRNREDDPPA
jgi:hypothetical protein